MTIVTESVERVDKEDAFQPSHPHFLHFTRNKLGGDLGKIVALGGQNYALNGTHGEVGVSLKNKNIFLRETHFHSVTTRMQAVVTIYYHCIIFLLPFNGNSMCK